MWSAYGSNYYFETNTAFNEKYCSQSTIKEIGAIDPSIVRSIAKRLTEVAPGVAHSSPKWSGKRPIIVIGKIDEQGEIKNPRCGLMNQDNKLYFWADTKVLANSPQSDSWAAWKGNDFRKYQRELGAYSDSDATHPLNAGGELFRILQRLNEIWVSNSTSFTNATSDKIKATRRKLEVDQNENEITPKLVSLTWASLSPGFFSTERPFLNAFKRACETSNYIVTRGNDTYFAFEQYPDEEYSNYFGFRCRYYEEKNILEVAYGITPNEENTPEAKKIFRDIIFNNRGKFDNRLTQVRARKAQDESKSIGIVKKEISLENLVTPELIDPFTQPKTQAEIEDAATHIYPKVEKLFRYEIKRFTDLVLDSIKDIISNSNEPAFSKVNGKTQKTSLQMKKNIILFGPPGTGKTYSTIAAAMAALGENATATELFKKLLNSELLSAIDIGTLRQQFSEKQKNDDVVFTTFHQNYSYEDFIEGIRVTSTEEGNAIYETRNGVFKKLARKALFYKVAASILKDNGNENLNVSSKSFRIAANLFATTSDEKMLDAANKTFGEETSDAFKQFSLVFEAIKARSYSEEKSIETTKKFVLIIDEINRGNISKIFGELITLIEDTKRFGGVEPLSITLPYSQESFYIPDNLYIIGTMNTADRSLAILDIALRRRFQFIEMMPQPVFLRDVRIKEIDLEKWLTRLNNNIQILRGREFTLGHAFFKELKNKENQDIESLAEIMRSSILPLLDEYFFEDWEGIRDVLSVTDDNPNLAFITREKLKSEMSNLGSKAQYLYSWNLKALTNPESYIRLYADKDSNDENAAS